MPSLETFLYIASGLGVGALLRELVRAIAGFGTVRNQSETSITLADRQIDADKEKVMQEQVNKLMVEWQQVLVESKELGSRVAIQNYIIGDLEAKLAEARERERQTNQQE
jgi:hypothetical protein